MNRFLARITPIVKVFIIGGIVGWSLFYFGGFTEKQGITLTVLLVMGYDLLMDTRRATQEKFEPYTVWIEPKWDDLLKDYKLVKEEEWEPPNGKLEKVPEWEYRVLRDGFSFTFLKPQLFDGLIYRNDRKYFRGELDFRERIEEIEIPMGEHNMKFSPTMFVRWGKEGYDIGITTPESFQKSYHPRDNLDLVTVATMPYEVFRGYENRSSFLKGTEKAQKSALEKHGWKQEERDKYLADLPDSFEHKYFFVSVNGI